MPAVERLSISVTPTIVQPLYPYSTNIDHAPVAKKARTACSTYDADHSDFQYLSHLTPSLATSESSLTSIASPHGGAPRPIRARLYNAPRKEWENYAQEIEGDPRRFYKCHWPLPGGDICLYDAKKQAMKRHIELTHLAYKSHSCGICGKSFGQRTSLSVHVATHTGEKAHLCPDDDCSKAYSDASRLLRHRVKVHGYIVRKTAPKSFAVCHCFRLLTIPSMAFQVKEIPTTPFDGQKPGTSGLRKRVKVFQQEHYTENFVQAIFDSITAQGATLVIGGDGRFFSPETVQTILRIGSANGVAKFIVGKDSILSTPTASNVIRKYKADGGILLTASHNPGGPDNDFGIKYNVSNGGPAPENVTNKIYEKTKTIKIYKVIDAPPVELSKVGDFTYGPTKVSIIDSVADYLILLKEIFDFPLIQSFLDAHKSDYRVLFDGLHGVTGPYAKEILVGALGLPETSIQNCVPLPDFGGGHPDPNLTYAHTLVDVVEKNGIEFGAASDGDGDRNMIYGKGAFVTPSDSVAIIANWAHVIPYFQKNGGVKGLARSMPTSKAIDLVAQKKGLEYFEVPTGWKFFGNLMDAGRLSICGEESFGTGSDHIREKDGLWAVVAWLNIIAAANANSPGKLIGITDLLQAHYEEYGRSFFSRYDYEEVPSEGANALVAHINDALKTGSLTNTVHTSQSTSTQFTISNLYDFEYTDPIDKSVSSNQGQVITFSDGSRVVFRLSGTGSQGATVRLYVERYVPPEAGPAELGRDAADGLKGLIEVALKISKLKEFLGRDKPTVIT
ncbi:hypothetical protein DXG03_007781 [Asterophora parasitica]|uniref:phosphoglucomutase (alpha-D-glucose-1,6-bisphosphate-dependent) n=1 Tax=Asterophora parasitica TaxID=117018 RepID=A0A9P7GIV3_9AGAR|nr:hypothetical protein DXG03_007781 [Asterophora parasitica]